MGIPESYQNAHVDFVSSEGGTTAGEIIKILLSISMTPLLVSLIFPWVIPPSFIQHATKDSSLYTFVRSIIEYPIIIVLPFWIVTILAGEDYAEASAWNNFVWVVILCSCLGLIIVNYSITEPKWEGFKIYWEKIKNMPFTSTEASDNGFSSSHYNNQSEQENVKQKDVNDPKESDKIKYPFITNYRGIVIYVTVVAILAVDFAIFPRRYAKTKKYGFSLMDIGTGSFIFSNGIVAPEAKNRKSNLLKSWISSLPLFALGFIRLIFVKGIEYHEVVEEYGAHWNFFFTLASVKLLSALIFAFIEPAYSLKLSVIVGILYEMLLIKGDMLNNYLLNSSTPRDTLWDANREGLYSVWGYLTIYLASVYIGKIMYCVKLNTIKEWALYVCRSGVHLLLLWIGLEISLTFGNPSCRRAANLSYCLWILATNYTVLWIIVIVNLVQAVVQPLGLLHGPLISFELKALMEREEEKIKKLNKQLKKKCYGKSVKEVKMEKALSLLEDKLKEFEQSGKSSIYSEVTALIKHLEEELKHIGAQLEEEEETQSESSPKKNLISMPDLTKSPVTLDAICYNGLLVFLLGNLLTGLVNCIVNTIYVPDYLALGYLWAYVSIVGFTSVFLYIYDIQFKFW